MQVVNLCFFLWEALLTFAGMIVFPNAKINIGLNVVSLRPDGFRNLESCFYPVQWCDGLEMVAAQENAFDISGIPVPGDLSKNLCLNAYNLIARDFKVPPVAMHLHKNLPIGAGLGGGSADAAFALKALNNLFGLHLSSEQLENYARVLGSDCAFFIRNQPVFAVERGDIFEPITLDLTGYHCVIVYPDIHITTAEAYRQVQVSQPEFSLRESLQKDISTWKDTIKNDFETALFPRYPVLPEIKAQLYTRGAVYAAMTGSGSAVFGIFKDEPGIIGFPANYRVWQGVL